MNLRLGGCRVAALALAAGCGLGLAAPARAGLFDHAPKYRAVQAYVMQPAATTAAAPVQVQVVQIPAQQQAPAAAPQAAPQAAPTAQAPAKAPTASAPQTITLQVVAAPAAPQYTVQTVQVQAAPVQTIQVQAAPVQYQVQAVQAAPVQTIQVQAAPVQYQVQAAPVQVQAAPTAVLAAPAAVATPATILVPKHRGINLFR